jgi:multiple sugar transport system permease protein
MGGKMLAKKTRYLNETMWGYAFLLPWIIAFLALQLYPLLLAFKTSFLDLNYLNVEKTKFVGIGNFGDVLAEPLFWKALFNVSFNQAIFIPLVILTGLAAAIMLIEINKFQNFFRVVYFIPFITSVTVAIMLFEYLTGPTGPIQSVLVNAGILDAELFWKSGSKWLPMPMIALFSAWKWFAVYMIIFLSGLAGMDPEIEEASYVDGAGWWKRLFHIRIPHLRPQFVFLITISIINGLQMFNEVFILYSDNLNGGPYYAALTPVLFLYREGFTYMKMGFASAVGILLAVIIFILTMVQLKFTVNKQ